VSQSSSKPRKLESRFIADYIVEINPKFQKVIELSGYCGIGVRDQGSTTTGRESNFSSLASSILSQQLSTKAAATIIDRVKELSGGTLRAEKLASLTSSELRAAGCSGAKARAIHELATATKNDLIPMRNLHQMSDEEIMGHLLPLFGVGKWTVEMFLIFQLQRKDIWPVGDLGVRRGWEKIHRMRTEVDPKKLAKLGAIYAPFRTHVAWYCWRAVEVL
jgi:DNA-3-methyladenine glycosylase II